jgi:phage portal protein BeeE
MPWDGTELRVAALDGGEPVSDKHQQQLIMGCATESVLAPVWRDDRSLYVISDRSGWWNLYVADLLDFPRALCPREEEFASPLWQLGLSPYAVLGDGMQYTQMSVNAHDAQLIEQLNWTALDVCVAFGVPPYKINVGPPPNYNNIQALDIQYYSQCLQELMESFEEALDFGLGLAPGNINGRRLGTELCREELLQMDTAGRMEAASKAIYSGMSPNEVRKRYHDVGPVKGGDAVYMQQQNYSLEALAKRDAQDDPFARATAHIDASAVGAQEAPADAAAATPAPAPAKALDAEFALDAIVARANRLVNRRAA